MDLDQLEHELEEEREQRKNQNQDRLSYYQQSILEILKAVQEGYSNILVEEEQRLLKDIKQLSGDAQRLFFRLYLRRATWFRVTKLDYKDVSDCDDAVSLLERAGLVECNVTEPEEILKILQLDEIKTMAKGFQVKGRNKEELVSALLATQKSRQTRLNFSTGIQRESIAQEASVRLLKEAKRLTGKIIRIPMVVADPLKRIIGLFFLRTSHLEEEADQLNTAILTDLNRRKYPPYLICRSAPVFASRRDWLEYEEALMYERTIAEVLSEGEITLDFVVDMLKTAKSNWTQHHPNGVTIKSYFLRRYSAGWAYTRALSSLAAVMEKLKAFKEANEIIEMLLCQDLYCVGQRGRWWERIVLNLDAHLGDKTEALGKCRQALTDEYVRTGSRLAIRRRLLKLLKYHDEKIKEEDAILDVEPEVITLYADPEDSRVTGRKLCFLLSGGVPGSVEAFALEHFKEQGWCGFHCESSIFRTLWTLCFWEILYGDAPDVFQTPYQTAPLDLKTDAFFQDRQEKILCRLEEVKQGLAPQLIVDAYYPFYGCQALGVSWNEYPLNALLDICHSLSGDVLAPIFRLLAEDYAGSFAGLPDLLLYRPDRSDYLLVEVKSTNDRLSDAQRNWNVVFRQHGIKSVMCRVLDTTAIDHRPKKSKTVEQLAALYDEKVPIEEFEPRLVTLTRGDVHIKCDFSGDSMSFESLKVHKTVIPDAKVILYDLPNITSFDSLNLRGNVSSNGHISLVKNLCMIQFVRQLQFEEANPKNQSRKHSSFQFTFLVRIYMMALYEVGRFTSNACQVRLINGLARRSSFLRSLIQRAYDISELFRRARRSRESVSLKSHELFASLIQLHNSQWLLAYDGLFGVALSFALWIMAPRVAQNCTEFLLKWTVEDIEKTISWLMGWPAGLKLNSNLNKFLGEMFLWLISLWSVLLYRWTFSMDAIVRVVALTGIFGASTLLAAAMDAIRMVTFHLRLFYLLATRMYSWEVRVLLSLFHLFRGKKWNVLHGRLDKADYDLDQLLLGTVLFTALVFIFPTVAVYYVLFLISLWGWLLITLAAEIVVQCLRSMPVFELAVSLADPSSLVTGIHASVEGSQLCIVTQLKSPIAILRPLFTSIGRMVSPLISLQTIGRMVSGKILTGTEEKSELPSPLPLF